MSRLKNKPSSKILIITFSFFILIIIISFALIIKSTKFFSPSNKISQITQAPITHLEKNPPPEPESTSILQPTPSTDSTSESTNKSNTAYLATHPTYSIEYNGYLYTVLIDQVKKENFIIRIPLDQEPTIENSEVIINFPDHLNERGGYPSFTIDNDNLYVCIAEFLGGNAIFYKITNQAPFYEIILDGFVGNFPEFYSLPPHSPNDIQLIKFYSKLGGAFSLYLYIPQENYMQFIVSTFEFNSTSFTVLNEFLGVRKNGSILTSQYFDHTYQFFSQINSFDLNYVTRQISSSTLIKPEKMPHSIKKVILNEKRDLLFLFGDRIIYTFDLSSNIIEPFLDLRASIFSKLHVEQKTTFENVSGEIFFSLPEDQNEYYTLDSHSPDELILELLRSKQKYLINLDTKEITQVE